MQIQPKVGEAYRSYRNYKIDMVQTFDKFYKQAQTILYQGDKENSNADSSLASTKLNLSMKNIKCLKQVFKWY